MERVKVGKMMKWMEEVCYGVVILVDKEVVKVSVYREKKVIEW